ncbi:hypothetical protein TrCOL_g4894 [Triparma columacea]|uniref:Uncharacterized protein n=1 Tax=Triparma columacea TaxID=722753 RepID=A0A9W7GB71_9STRA|nr:hypothetical protein TrCOL_g4894 [Triparma columacea]
MPSPETADSQSEALTASLTGEATLQKKRKRMEQDRVSKKWNEQFVPPTIRGCNCGLNSSCETVFNNIPYLNALCEDIKEKHKTKDGLTALVRRKNAWKALIILPGETPERLLYRSVMKKYQKDDGMDEDNLYCMRCAVEGHNFGKGCPHYEDAIEEEAIKPRTKGRIYHLPTSILHGVHQNPVVCEQTFRSTLGIKSKSTLTNLAKEIKEETTLGGGNSTGPGSGGHNRLSQELRDLVVKSVEELGFASSHYQSTEANNEKQFIIDGSYSIVDCYLRYFFKHEPESLDSMGGAGTTTMYIPGYTKDNELKPHGFVPPKVNYQAFCRVLNEYNFSFEKPRSDCCGKCDRLYLEIRQRSADARNARERPAERVGTRIRRHGSRNEGYDDVPPEVFRDEIEGRLEELREELKQHQDTAHATYQLRKRLIAESKQSEGKATVLQIDAAANPRCPYTRVGPSFYKRIYGLYCYIICDSLTGKNYYYMWDETISNKGADAIGSIIRYHIMTTMKARNSGTEKVRKVSIFSDGTAGQVWNYVNFKAFHEYVDPKSPWYSFDHIDVLRGPVGHTYMMCDTVGGLVQQAANRLLRQPGQHIYGAWEVDEDQSAAPLNFDYNSWEGLARKVDPEKLSVIRLGSKDFINIAKELEHRKSYAVTVKGKKDPAAGFADENWGISKTHHWKYFNGKYEGDENGFVGYVETTDCILDDQLVDQNNPKGVLVKLCPETWTSQKRSLTYVKDVILELLDTGSPVGYEKLKDLWDIFKYFPKEARDRTKYLIDTTRFKDAEDLYTQYPEQRPKPRKERPGVSGA